MAISNESIIDWIDRIASIDGVAMDPTALVDDVVLMAYVFPDEPMFYQAMISVTRAIDQLVATRVDPSSLQQNYKGWDSFHFQSVRGQGHPADLRIVFQTSSPSGIRIRGFGHRHLPADIYRRLRVR